MLFVAAQVSSWGDDCPEGPYSSCVETDKVILYGHLFKALKDGLYEACLEPHEESKDGLAVMNSIVNQHGGTAI